jgi:hypothetical protein
MVAVNCSSSILANLQKIISQQVRGSNKSLQIWHDFEKDCRDKDASMVAANLQQGRGKRNIYCRNIFVEKFLEQGCDKRSV